MSLCSIAIYISFQMYYFASFKFASKPEQPGLSTVHLEVMTKRIKMINI